MSALTLMMSHRDDHISGTSPRSPRDADKEDNISSTLKSKEILEELTNKGVDVYNYGLGENPLKQPTLYIDMVKQFADEKKYSPCTGVKELNNVLIEKYNNDLHNKNDVLVGNGLKELIFIIQCAFRGKIIHITPSWVVIESKLTFWINWTILSHLKPKWKMIIKSI